MSFSYLLEKHASFLIYNILEGIFTQAKAINTSMETLKTFLSPFNLKMPGSTGFQLIHPSRSRFLYCMASATCSVLISPLPSRSAMVRDTFRIRS